MLAHVTDNELELWMPVENTVCDHAQGVQCDTDGETQRRTDEPFSVCVQFLVDSTGWTVPKSVTATGILIRDATHFLGCR